MNVYLRTFGCRANRYDSEVVRAMVEGGGHAIVSNPADADAAIFNSCAVTSQAEAELRKAVRQAARARPSLRSVVMGCAAALPAGTASGRALRALPTVERLIAGADMLAVATALDLPPGAHLTRAVAQSGTRALLRVQDGCDEHCTFCATTIARGESRSRSIDELVEEATRLADGHPEIVITGIHIGSYGEDTGSSLGALLHTLVRRVPTVRFRLSSLEATEIDDLLFELLTGDLSRVAPHLHAPLQSGSDAVLRRMGRHWYTARDYARAVERLARSAGVLGLGADVIAGFPGETAADHGRTVELVESLPFTYLHVFAFSCRPGTAAERLEQRVPESRAKDRAQQLREVAAIKQARYVASRAGGTGDVIVIGSPTADEEPDGGREGLTEDYLQVRVPDRTLPRGARFSGALKLQDGQLVACRPNPGS